MADGERANEVAAGTSIIIWRMNGTESRNLDDIDDRKASVNFQSLAN